MTRNNESGSKGFVWNMVKSILALLITGGLGFIGVLIWDTHQAVNDMKRDIVALQISVKQLQESVADFKVSIHEQYKTIGTLDGQIVSIKFEHADLKSVQEQQNRVLIAHGEQLRDTMQRLAVVETRVQDGKRTP